MNTLLTLAQYSSGYTTTSTSSQLDDSASAAIFLGVLLFTFVMTVIAYVIMSLLLGRIFKKAGVPAWTAWVPFYSNYKLLEIGGQPGYWAILAIIPGVNIAAAVFMYIAMYNIGLKLGKSGTFVLWALFLPIVWSVWLAVDASAWNDTLGAPSTPTIPPTHTPSV